MNAVVRRYAWEAEGREKLPVWRELSRAFVPEV
jgi:hypothetical protein